MATDAEMEKRKSNGSHAPCSSPTPFVASHSAAAHSRSFLSAMGFTSFRMGHLHKAPKVNAVVPRAPDAACAKGGFYKSPSNGASIDSLKPLDITWDTTCLQTDKVDIHLLAPWYKGDNTEMTLWPNVPFAAGQYTVNIKPKWWNATSSINLQLAIVPAGTPPSSTTLPAGPLFIATYTPPADGSIPASADVTKPDSASDSALSGGTGTKRSISGGQAAAAVLIPLLIVGFGIFAYLRFQRRRAAEKSKRFSQAIDKRMSTISTDWKSMSAAGAQAAIRSSMAVNRESSAFPFGGIRPVSTASNLAVEGGGPGIPQMTQVRTGTGVGLRHPGGAPAFAAERASRVSRVSFADTVGRPSGDQSRPSGETRRTRAFHSSYIPPVPTRKDVVSNSSVYPDSEIGGVDEKDGQTDRDIKAASPTLSPRQTTGPLTLTPDDIRARIQGHTPASQQEQQQDEYDAVMPALSMMRTGLEPSTPSAMTTSFNVPAAPPTEEYLETALPAPPAPTHTSSFNSASPLSPISPPPASPFGSYAYAPSSPSTMAPPSATLSPDDMLRAYAERKTANGSPAPSSYNSSPGPKGRKLSLRASFGLKKKSSAAQLAHAERPASPMVIDKGSIGYPVPASPAPAVTSSGRAGVGAGMAGVGVGAGLAGAAYAIGEYEEDGEDEHMDYNSAYVI
ncbi:hypothetical protein H0H81_002238 [Sphagnurus paluster]|uniref:Uncharacterized protein n=1 Tax=Sphagnurus paluster TaxID=117069 RepID=A0A9P7K2Y2_9AGAR|nr:hypothetical protein H0H81_002238 [Sphagnurus paluster]